MSGVEAAGVPIAVRVGVVIVQRLAPSGLALVKSWLKGKEILVIGQPRAGKTTFVDYLQYGLFQDEQHTEKTTEHVLSPRFNVKIGRDSALELTVKTTVDIPGQWGAVKHADVAFERNPHAIVILIDATAPLRGDGEDASPVWLHDFCKRLEAKWRSETWRSNRLKVMMVLINKSDKAKAAKMESCKKQLRRILDGELRDGRGKMSEEVAIMPSCVVTNPNGTKAIDSAIAHLAKVLAR